MLLLLSLLCVSLRLSAAGDPEPVKVANPGAQEINEQRALNPGVNEERKIPSHRFKEPKEVDEEEEEEEESTEWTTKVVPAFLKPYQHGIVFGPENPATEKSNASTIYVEPEFKRFCNDCEDYWHPKCVHYPHIYDDSKGCVLKTLGPKSLAEMEGDDEYDDDDDDEYDEDEEDEYGEEEEEEHHEADGGEVTPKKKPEVLMKAEEIEAMRARINQMAEQRAGQGNVTGPEAHLDQKQINAVIREAMAGKFANATTLREDEEEETVGTRTTLVQGTTTTLEPETIAFSNEDGGPKITIYKEIMDDADAVLDMRINNALLSCPREFVVAQSGIPDVQLGVWTKVALPAGVVMGPFRGRVQVTDTQEEDSEDRAKPPEHVLYIYHPKTRQLLYKVDGRSNTLGNWCRYINAARHESEQNLEVFFDAGKPFPFFRTTKPIEKNTELLADFGQEFRKGRYTSLVNVFYHQALLKDLPQRLFPCSRCGVDQGNPIAIQRHRKQCNATRAKKTPRPLKKKHRPDETDETSIEVWTPPRHTKPRPVRPGNNKKMKGKS